MAGSDNVSPRLVSDWTLNWPTLLAMFAMVVSGVFWAVTTYNGVDRRVSALQRDTVELRRDVDRFGKASNDYDLDQDRRREQLRQETRSELRDINEKLDQLLLTRQASTRKGLDGWTR